MSFKDRKISNSFFAGTLVTLISWAGCAPLMARSDNADDRHPTLSKAPPHPSRLPPNASRITAMVRKYAIWPLGSVKDRGPQSSAGQTLYSVTVEIETTAPESPDLTSRAQPGMVVDAFSSNVPSPDLVGKKIIATF